MGWRMVKQPNGTYARWTDIVDGFTHVNLSRREALEVCRESLARFGSLEAEQKVKRADLDEVEGDKSRFEGIKPGLRRWVECISTMRDLKHDQAADEALKLDREFKPEPEPELPPLKLDKLTIMFSEPQTLICTTDGVGIATVHGDTREEREQVARWLVEKVNGSGDLEEAAQFVVDLFDPMPTKAKVSPALLRAIAQGAKNANKTLRERLAERGHTLACLTTHLDTFDPACPTCNPKPGDAG